MYTSSHCSGYTLHLLEAAGLAAVAAGHARSDEQTKKYDTAKVQCDGKSCALAMSKSESSILAGSSAT